jgi:hypothetical protein
MQREGHLGRARGHGRRRHEERPLVIELAQLLLDVYRVWESLMALGARLRSEEEVLDEDSSGL